MLAEDGIEAWDATLLEELVGIGRDVGELEVGLALSFERGHRRV